MDEIEYREESIKPGGARVINAYVDGRLVMCYTGYFGRNPNVLVLYPRGQGIHTSRIKMPGKHEVSIFKIKSEEKVRG